MSQGVFTRQSIQYEFYDKCEGGVVNYSIRFNERLNNLRASASRMNTLWQPTNSPRIIYYIWSELNLYEVYKISVFKTALDLLFMAPILSDDKINDANIYAEMQLVV